jgi:hypothetical protein
MIRAVLRDDKLPTEHSLPEALRIYIKRLGIFVSWVVGCLLVGAWAWLVFIQQNRLLGIIALVALGIAAVMGIWRSRTLRERLKLGRPVLMYPPSLRLYKRIWTWFRLGRYLQPQRWTPALGALLLLVLLISTTVIASASSLPGDPLYPVKLVSEQVQLMVARGEAQRATLEVRFEERRLQEAQMVVQTNRRARLYFSGTVEEVTPDFLRIGRLVVHLDKETTQVEGAPMAGATIKVVAISPGTGNLIALEVQVLGIPTPRPTPTLQLTPAPADTPTVAPTPRPTPTWAIEPRPLPTPIRRIITPGG